MLIYKWAIQIVVLQINIEMIERALQIVNPCVLYKWL